MVNKDSLAPTPIPVEKELEELREVEFVDDIVDNAETQIGEPFNLVVWDDDIHVKDDFVSAFSTHFSMPVMTAVEKAQQIIEDGRSIVARGSFTDMEFHSLALTTNFKMTTTVEQG